MHAPIKVIYLGC